ncbi:hypothetical protein OUZ56_011604 [Daphnia magna]|uniref:Secreted protein n=1 Tax=Daphnia magna TaxID=35525 RepID=A0ABQ9Z0M2_9CRUS|nr:hypothetical protein OUZ56_011604 [Daphnia magna]
MASAPQYEHMPRNALMFFTFAALEPSTGGCGKSLTACTCFGSGNTPFLSTICPNARSCGWANICPSQTSQYPAQSLHMFVQRPRVHYNIVQIN